MNPDAVQRGASDGDDVGISINRSVIALTASRSTPSDNGAIGSESDTVVEPSACDSDEVGIRRSVVALTASRSTPSDHGTIGSESDAVMPPAYDGDEIGFRRSVVAPTVSRVAPSDHGAAGDTTSRQATKRGGVAFFERSYTTERVHCARRE